jgi:NitT/TauT family transport system substrate-binding protein
MDDLGSVKPASNDSPNRFFAEARKRFALEWWGFVVILIVLGLVAVRVRDRGKVANEGLLGRPLRVGIVPWPGYAGGLVANHGLKPNKDSVFWKSHNLLVEFVVIKNDVDLRRAFALGGEKQGIDVMWSTVDSLAQQYPEFSKEGIRPRAFMQVDWSRGGDAIIARAGIDRIEDLKLLKEKRIAVSMAASQWLFEYSLENSSLTDDERALIRQNLRRLTNGSSEARDLFINSEVDVAVLWEPDVQTAKDSRRGSHILVDTSAASKLVADVMVAQEEFIGRDDGKVIKAFINGWLDGTTMAINDPMLAVKILMDEPELDFDGFGEDKTRAALRKTVLATLDDNAEMFGLSDGDAFFDHLFDRASRLWLKDGYIRHSANALLARETRFVQEIYDKQQETIPRTGCDQNPPTVELPVIFPPDKADLSSEARRSFDEHDIPLLLRTNSDFRFCVEVGVNDGDDPVLAPETRRKREYAVIQYLIAQYKRPPSQFVSTSPGASQTAGDGKITEYIRLRLLGRPPIRR